MCTKSLSCDEKIYTPYELIAKQLLSEVRGIYFDSIGAPDRT